MFTVDNAFANALNGRAKGQDNIRQLIEREKLHVIALIGFAVAGFTGIVLWCKIKSHACMTASIRRPSVLDMHKL
jgi:hypothetical protein